MDWEGKNLQCNGYLHPIITQSGSGPYGAFPGRVRPNPPRPFPCLNPKGLWQVRQPSTTVAPPPPVPCHLLTARPPTVTHPPPSASPPPTTAEPRRRHGDLWCICLLRPWVPGGGILVRAVVVLWCCEFILSKSPVLMSRCIDTGKSLSLLIYMGLFADTTLLIAYVSG